MNKIKICLADDHTLFRKLTRGYLQTFDRIDPLILEARNGQELLSQLRKRTVDVVMLDIEMPRVGGEDAATTILRRYPDIKIVVLTIHENPNKVLQMMNLGVHGYLLKDCEPEEIIRSIESVVDRDFYRNKLSAQALGFKQKTQTSEERLIAELTSREKEILFHICEECTTKEISEKLSISVKTVENHRMNMLQKLKVKSTVGLVKYAYDTRLFPLN